MAIYDEYKRFSDVHPNIILKTELVRLGLNISENAQKRFQEVDDIAWKGYHFFSYDRGDTVVMSNKVPMQLRLEDGCPVQIETDERSPFTLDYDFQDDEYFITENGTEKIARHVYFPHKPRWYGMKLDDGTPMEAVIQCFGDGNLFLIFNNYCELWNTHDDCKFCNINHTLKEQKSGGEESIVRKSIEQISEVLETAISIDRLCQRQIIVSGGMIKGRYQGQNEIEFFTSRLQAMHDRLRAAPPLTIQIGAQTEENWKRLKDTGIVTTVEPNMEVWNREMFKQICPGKDKYVGYDEWIRRMFKGVEIFGEYMVNPNFVLGVEMCKPYGYTNVSEAVKGIVDGWDYLMAHGVLPRQRLWFIEKGSALGPYNPTPPPLEYYIETQKGFFELRQKYGIELPYASQMGTFQGYVPSSQTDFEYYHGSGPLSKKVLEARGYKGVPAYDKINH